VRPLPRDVDATHANAMKSASALAIHPARLLTVMVPVGETTAGAIGLPLRAGAEEHNYSVFPSPFDTGRHVSIERRMIAAIKQPCRIHGEDA
jgi:hypothetical protein